MSKREREEIIKALGEWTTMDISPDGFIEIENLPPIDLIGLSLQFTFGGKDDEYMVLMVIASGDIPCPECKEMCEDCIIMKTKRKSDDAHCDIFTCKICGFSMSVAPDTVMISKNVLESIE